MISAVNHQPIAPLANRTACGCSSKSEEAALPKESVTIAGADVEVNLADVLAATAKEAASLEGKLNDHVAGELIVKLRPDMGALESMNDFASDYGAAVIEKFDIPQNMYKSFDGEMVHIKLPAGMTTAQAIAAMEKDERVQYAATNDKLNIVDEGGGEDPEPPALNEQLWGMNNTGQTGGTDDADIDAPEAWQIQTGKGAADNGPVIAVIDTGIDYNHPALAGNIWTNPNEVADGVDNDGNGIIDDIHGYNAPAESGDPMDDNAHGTHCSGTIAGNGQDNGLYGVQHNSQLMGVKFLTASGGGTLADAIKAVMYSTEQGARITSNSWGGGGFNQALYDALEASPALHIFAAGNSSNDDDRRATYPSAFDLDNIVSVAATDHNDNLASFSNYGATTVDLAAPGVDVLSSVPGGEYRSFSGTSMATPHVAGAAGLLVSQFPDISNEELKARLMNGVDKKSQLEGRVLTGGRLNINNSLEEDNIAPGAPNDFRARSTEPGSVVLGWTATGDDHWCGDANGYVLKMSDRPIVEGDAADGQVSFDTARNMPVGSPQTTGQIENNAISVPLSGQEKTYHFALKVQDNVGNLSEIRTTSVTVPAAHVAFEDTLDNDGSNWSADGWAQVEVEGRGKVFTDSPEGDYENDANRSLMSREIDLSTLQGSTLVFDRKFDLENRYDKVHVEVAEIVPEPPPEQPPEDGAPLNDGGDTPPPAEPVFNNLATFTGSGDWANQQIDLSAYDGKNVKLRFRLESDGSVTRDGFYLDNVVIAGQEAPEPPPEEPPTEG